MVFQQQQKSTTTISDVFLDVTIGNDYFPTFPTIAIFGANDDRQQCFAHKKGPKWPKKLN